MTNKILTFFLFFICANSTFALVDGCIDVSLYGFLNQAYFSFDDGVDTYWFIGNNDNDDTTIHLTGTLPVAPGVTFSGNLLNAIKNNSSDTYSQLNPYTTNLWTFRAYEVKLQAEGLGTLYYGFGETASDNSAEVDFTPVYFVQYSEVYDVGNAFFLRRADGTLDGVTIGDAFDNLDGLNRQKRIRYDTPKMFNSLFITFSYAQKNSKDIALFYDREFPSMKFGAAIAYSEDYTSTNHVQQHILDGSFCIMHNSGLNLTAAAGKLYKKVVGALDPSTHYIKLGYARKFVPLGQSCVSFDTGKYYRLTNNDAKGTAIGAAFVQYIDKWQTQVYAAWRKYKLNHGSTAFRDMNIWFAGIRINFETKPTHPN